MVQIERLRAMAEEAVAEYLVALRAGGEPIFPQWTDDIFWVCDLAAFGMQSQDAVRDRPMHIARAAYMKRQLQPC